MLRTTFILLATIAIVLAKSEIRSPKATKQRPSKTTAKNNQVSYLYEFFSQQGRSLTIADYVPDLSSQGFSNIGSSNCFNGIYMFYDAFYYNEGRFHLPMFYGWGEDFCIDFPPDMDDKATSVRYAGDPADYKTDSLNFYEEPFFMGDEQFTFDDDRALDNDNFGRSLILTGCSPWTLYELDSFLGRSICVFPTDGVNCYPSFFETEADMGGFANEVSSVKRGCFSKRKLMGKTVPQGKLQSKIGATGSNIE